MEHDIDVEDTTIARSHQARIQNSEGCWCDGLWHQAVDRYLQWRENISAVLEQEELMHDSKTSKGP